MPPTPISRVSDTIEEGVKTTEDPPEKVSSAAPSNRNKWYALAIVVFCVVVFAVVLPTALILGDDDDKDDKDDDDDDISQDRASFLVVDGPFKVNLTLFNEDLVTNPYTDPVLLKQDLKDIAKFFLNGVFYRNTNRKGFENVGWGSSNFGGYGGYRGYAGILDPAAEAPLDDAKPAVGDTVNDFGTNNQETNIQQGDVVVSDGERGKQISSPVNCV
jgi:hypothetical protein